MRESGISIGQICEVHNSYRSELEEYIKIHPTGYDIRAKYFKKASEYPSPKSDQVEKEGLKNTEGLKVGDTLICVNKKTTWGAENRIDLGEEYKIKSINDANKSVRMEIGDVGFIYPISMFMRTPKTMARLIEEKTGGSKPIDSDMWIATTMAKKKSKKEEPKYVSAFDENYPIKECKNVSWLGKHSEIFNKQSSIKTENHGKSNKDSNRTGNQVRRQARPVKRAEGRERKGFECRRRKK